MRKLMQIGLVAGVFAVTGLLPVSTKAVALTCRQECLKTFTACRLACNGDADCIAACQDQSEYCQCSACGYCP